MIHETDHTLEGAHFIVFLLFQHSLYTYSVGADYLMDFLHPKINIG